MSNQQRASRPNSTAWQTESLRTTCFLRPTTQNDASNWWETVIGHQPDNRISRIKEGVQQDEGTLDGVKYILGVHPIRADWLAVSDDPEEKPWIGSFTSTLESYRDIMMRWLQIAPPIERLAFGAVLMLPVDDREAGYGLIAQYLPSVRLDPVRSSDFLYQINRPRDSQTGIPDLPINRLAKWSVARRGRALLELSGPQTRVSYFPASEHYACRLELDINTIAGYEPDLPSDRLGDLFRELTDLGRELASEGDIP